jgi:hypothetical protein
LAITQEMGMRLSLITRKGLGDLIRENYGIKVSVVMFFCLFFANLGTIIVDVAAFKTTANLLHLPAVPLTVLMIVFVFFFVTKGNFKVTQNIMRLSSFSTPSDLFSAVPIQSGWGLATRISPFPGGTFSPATWPDHAILGLGVTRPLTITPWGQFFIQLLRSRQAHRTGTCDLHRSKLRGRVPTLSFVLVKLVATAATLCVSRTALDPGRRLRLPSTTVRRNARIPFFAFGIMNAGCHGHSPVGLTTAYAFSDVFRNFGRS